MSNTIAIQGLPGSYTEEATMEIEPGIDRSDILYLETFDDVFRAVRTGQAGRAVVAFSNTRIDSIQRPSEILLGHDSMEEFWVDGGVTIPVHHCLAGLPGVKIEDIRNVVSQPEALRQCGELLRSLNGQVTRIESRDTALSAQEVRMANSRDMAAICSTNAAELHGLSVLQTDVQDDDINLTRFVRFTKSADARIQDENPDNSIVVLRLGEGVGSLDHALSTFTSHGIDIRTIRSRNIPNTDMRVDMIAELRRGVDDEMREVVIDLANIGATMTFIGTYKDKSKITAIKGLKQEFNTVSVEDEVDKFNALLERLRR